MCQCPFLSSSQEKVTCFAECAFYNYEGVENACPFKDVKGQKRFNFKEILKFDFDKPEEDDFYEDPFIKEYQKQRVV